MYKQKERNIENVGVNSSILIKIKNKKKYKYIQGAYKELHKIELYRNGLTFGWNLVELNHR